MSAIGDGRPEPAFPNSGPRFFHNARGEEVVMCSTLRRGRGIGRIGWPVLLAGFLAATFAWYCLPARAAPKAMAEQVVG